MMVMLLIVDPGPVATRYARTFGTRKQYDSGMDEK